MATQTAEQLKAAFGAGKFPNVTNWENLIDTIFSRGVGRGQIHHIEMNAYESPWWDGYYDTERVDVDNIGGYWVIANMFDYADHTYTSPYSPIFVKDFERIYNKKEADIDRERGIEPKNSYISTGDIVLVHNDGAFYNEMDTTHGEIYIQWTAGGAGEYWDWYASDSRYYEYDGQLIRKPQIIELPLGCTVAFAKTNGGLQPIGNFIAYDYDALMQKVQNNPMRQH